MSYNIRVYVKEVETKDGKKFPTYSCREKSGKWVRLKFTRTVEPPKTGCIMVVDKTDINRAVENDFPVYWVHKVIEYLPYEKIEQNLDEYFD